MTYLRLFIGFFEVGCFAFGGAYAAIPVIRDMVIKYGFVSDKELSRMIAISESTPGSIIVNLATFVGSREGGIFGAVVSTIGATLPAFLIILIIGKFFKEYMENKCAATIMNGLKSCVIGIIMSVGLYMIFESIISKSFKIDNKALLIGMIILLYEFIYRYIKNKNPSAIKIIIISAILGVIIF